jgi:hypothetical protein
MSKKFKKLWRERARPILQAYSTGTISSREAVRRLRVRDTTDLLWALGDAKIRLPMPPADEIERQSDFIATIMRGESPS